MVGFSCIGSNIVKVCDMSAICKARSLQRELSYDIVCGSDISRHNRSRIVIKPEVNSLANIVTDRRKRDRNIAGINRCAVKRSGDTHLDAGNRELERSLKDFLFAIL